MSTKRKAKKEPDSLREYLNAALADCDKCFTILEKKPTRNDLAAFINYHTGIEFRKHDDKMNRMLVFVRNSNESLMYIGKSKKNISVDEYLNLVVKAYTRGKDKKSPEEIAKLIKEAKESDRTIKISNTKIKPADF